MRPHQLQDGIRTVRTSVNIFGRERSRVADYMPSHKGASSRSRSKTQSTDHTFTKVRRDRSCERKSAETYPLFRGSDFLYRSDYGRVSRFRAQSELGCQVETCHYLIELGTISGAVLNWLRGFEIGAENGRFPGQRIFADDRDLSLDSSAKSCLPWVSSDYARPKTRLCVLAAPNKTP
jgi:hypothetical protein